MQTIPQTPPAARHPRNAVPKQTAAAATRQATHSQFQPFPARHDAIADALRTLDRAAAMSSTGPYQLQAAIAAVHSEAASWEATDWRQIVGLYDLLLDLTDTPVIRLNRAEGGHPGAAVR